MRYLVCSVLAVAMVARTWERIERSSLPVRAPATGITHVESSTFSMCIALSLTVFHCGEGLASLTAAATVIGTFSIFPVSNRVATTVCVFGVLIRAGAGHCRRLRIRVSLARGARWVGAITRGQPTRGSCNLSAEEHTLKVTKGCIGMRHACNVHHRAVSVSSPTLPFSIGECP